MSGSSKTAVLGATLHNRVEMLKQLVVTSADEPGRLFVDATALAAAGDDGVRHWDLSAERDTGTWTHDESGMSGSLGQVLYAIAASYEVDVEVEPGRPERPKLSPARRRALEVLAHGYEIGRPVRSSDHTTDLDAGLPPAAPVDLCIHNKVADWLEAEGLAERTDRMSYYFRLSDTGHELVAGGMS